jgi:DNA-binding NarL/FixJ family response regulator
VGLGQLDRAEQLLGPWEEEAERVGLAWSLATSARCRALYAAATGDMNGARHAVARSLAHHQRLALPFELARTLLVQGQIERRAKQKLAARRPLQQALAIFERLDAPAWAARAQAELDRTGRRTTAPDELTTSERRVAELAATGLTNRQVGAALFVSGKTVEANLGRVYRKLAIKTRAELGVRLAAVPA